MFGKNIYSTYAEMCMIKLLETVINSIPVGELLHAGYFAAPLE